jgi:hypothetical protein
MNGEKTPCIPSLVPVVQLAQPGKLFGRIVDLRGAQEPSLIKRPMTGNLPDPTSGDTISNLAPSNPMTTVFIDQSCPSNSPSWKVLKTKLFGDSRFKLSCLRSELQSFKLIMVVMMLNNPAFVATQLFILCDLLTGEKFLHRRWATRYIDPRIDFSPSAMVQRQFIVA